jgi:hypothetical protein
MRFSQYSYFDMTSLQCFSLERRTNSYAGGLHPEGRGFCDGDHAGLIVGNRGAPVFRGHPVSFA